jgi:hypothetical protein
MYPRGQNPLSYTILYDESKHNILALVGKANKMPTQAKLFIFKKPGMILHLAMCSLHTLEKSKVVFVFSFG